METSELELRAKLGQKKNLVIAAVSNIEKTGQNSAQNYWYAEEREVVRAIRKAFIDAKISFAVEAGTIEITHKIKDIQPHFALELKCTLTDCETGYSESSKWYGAAMDYGDKAFYKCYTSGVKYFLMKTFLLPTGDDVEVHQDDPDEKKKPAAKPTPPINKPASAKIPPKPATVPSDQLPTPTKQESEVMFKIYTILAECDEVAGKLLSESRMVEYFYKTYKQYPSNPQNITKAVDHIKSQPGLLDSLIIK